MLLAELIDFSWVSFLNTLVICVNIFQVALIALIELFIFGSQITDLYLLELDFLSKDCKLFLKIALGRFELFCLLFVPHLPLF